MEQSLSIPAATLHRPQSIPRICPVLWLWSTQATIDRLPSRASLMPQAPHFHCCFSSLPMKSSNVSPYLFRSFRRRS